MTARVYRLFDADNALLYVGQTCQPIGKRISAHRRTQPWWSEVARCEVTEFMTSGDALITEHAAIRDERPRYNAYRNNGSQWFGIKDASELTPEEIAEARELINNAMSAALSGIRIRTA